MIEYKFEGYEMFQNMIDSIQDDVVRYIFRVNVVQPQQEQKRQVTEPLRGGRAEKPVRRENKVGATTLSLRQRQEV